MTLAFLATIASSPYICPWYHMALQLNLNSLKKVVGEGDRAEGFSHSEPDFKQFHFVIDAKEGSEQRMPEARSLKYTKDIERKIHT